MTPRTYWLCWVLWTVAVLVAVRVVVVQPILSRLDALRQEIETR